MTMLACARMGAVHSAVFAGFSADALAARVVAAKSRVVITADVGKRGGKNIPLHSIVTDARTKQNMESTVESILVWERFYDEANILESPDKYIMQPKDVRMNIEVAKQRPYYVPVSMDSEDALFILYTSGSTGQPKGLLHTTGGYAVYAAMTAQQTFDLVDDDIFACVADCGWITGHTYVVYGPLLNGCTTFLFESTPVYPDAGRYWDMIARHGITQFYTAPTAVRLLMKYGAQPVNKHDILSTLRVLGTVGEPINPEAWRWYWQVVGQKQCTVVDTYWQTETGGHILTNLPGVTPMKPGSCTFPIYGIDSTIVDPVTGQEVTELDEDNHRKGVLVVKHPWPGMARTCLGDHERYLQTYFLPYPGYYFTGDSAYIDSDGYTFIIGRVDDVINVSGHRIGTAEVESALVSHQDVAQAAVVGQPHPIKGQSIAAFVMLTNDAIASDVANREEYETRLLVELKQLVRRDIGSFATPDLICIAPTLPMTRSGKIMRRILRKIVCQETDSLGDTSTLADPSIVDILIQQIATMQK
jgi:acetyl-CoA synthetase